MCIDTFCIISSLTLNYAVWGKMGREVLLCADRHTYAHARSHTQTPAKAHAGLGAIKGHKALSATPVGVGPMHNGKMGDFGWAWVLKIPIN